MNCSNNNKSVMRERKVGQPWRPEQKGREATVLPNFGSNRRVGIAPAMKKFIFVTK
jgi:hypothetical protein